MRQDLKRMQGCWAISSLEVDGQAMPPAVLQQARLEIIGNRFTSTGMGAVYEGVVELDAAANPAHIDLKFDSGPEKGNTNPGIYEFAGEGLRLCLATRGGVRPASFATTPGSGFACETLSRVDARVPRKPPRRVSHAAAPTNPNRAPSTEFEGEWSMVSGVMDGQPMDKSVLKWVKRITKGSQTTVYTGPQVLMKFDFTTNPAVSPKAIDYRNTAGSNQGKTQNGIYEFDGELLTINLAAPGAARPTQFKSERGSGTTLTVWKRA